MIAAVGRSAERAKPMAISFGFVSLACAVIGLIIMFADTKDHPWIDRFGQVCWAIAIAAAAGGFLGE